MTRATSLRLSRKTLSEVDRFAADLKTNRSEAIRRIIERGLREAKIENAIELLRGRKISVGRAAEMAGTSLYEMLDLARERGIPYGYGSKDLDEDLRAFGYRR